MQQGKTTDTTDWLGKWERSEIGFHLETVNPMFAKHWPALGAAADDTVFVPLCGKSLDMVALQQQGHRVVGSELSPIAISEFFKGLPDAAKQQRVAQHTHWQSGHIKVIEGDFFTLPAGGVQARWVYDRAALIALPEAMQRLYLEQLLRVAPEIKGILLITTEYPADAIDPPPFSIPTRRVRAIYSDDFTVNLLESRQTQASKSLQERGLDVVTEHVFKLDRK